MQDICSIACRQQSVLFYVFIQPRNVVWLLRQVLFEQQLLFFCLAELVCKPAGRSLMCSGAGWTAQMLRGGLTHQISSTRSRVAPSSLSVKRNTDKPSELSACLDACSCAICHRKPSVELLDLGSEIENPSMTFDLREFILTSTDLQPERPPSIVNDKKSSTGGRRRHLNTTLGRQHEKCLADACVCTG